jgi:TATA-box binding protein (TBP) (component of TFIID and TFIIIB)
MTTQLDFKKFEDIPVSTKTFIVMTNISIDIQTLFNFLPITEYTIIQKKRGRKKKTVQVNPNKNIPNGSIITLDLANNIRGVLTKKKKKKEGKSTDYFRNSITVVMIIDEKKINFKISRNGKFQMTGCKYNEHAEKCIKYIWEYIKDCPSIYNIAANQPFKAIFIPAMRNIDFNMGFSLDREKLDEYFNTNTEYYSLLETSIGYTGVNIKIPVKIPITELRIKQLIYEKDDWKPETYIPYEEYLNTLKPKDRQKKIDKERYNTFLVFHSGKVIMSSMCEEFAVDTYYEFVDIIKNNYKRFREILN